MSGTRVALVPTRVDDALVVDLLDIGRDDFAGPLFDDVVEAAAGSATTLRVPAAELLVTGGPAGIVAHVGRCGSTLLCALLATADGWVTVREPEVLNDVLLRRDRERDPRRRAALSALVPTLLRGLAHGVRLDAQGRPRRCVVKLTSWNLLLGRDLLEASSVPLVVLTRDPWSVVGSLLRDPPYWHAAGPGEPPEESARLLAQVWSHTVDAALRLPDDRTLLVDYGDLAAHPGPVLGRVLGHLGHEGAVSPSAVAEVVSRDAKHPDEPYPRHDSRRPATLDVRCRTVVAEVTASSRASLAARTRRTPRSP